MSTTTIVPAAPGYRLTRVYFADASGPAMLDVTPVIGFVVDAETGAVTPIVLPVEGLDPAHPDCGIEGPDFPGVIARGCRFVTLTLFIESRRDALRAAVERAARVGEAP